MARRGDHIRKRADGRWEGRYRIQKNDGSYKYVSIYGKSYHEVKERLILFQAGHFTVGGNKKTRLETNSQKDAISFCYLMEEWLGHVERTRKYSTYIKYLNIYSNHIKEYFSSASLLDLSNHYVRDNLFSADSGEYISSNTKHNILSVINQTLKYAHEYHGYPLIKLNNEVEKESNRPVEIMNHTEQAKLISYLYSNLDISKTGILICLYTGLRLGEICSLKWDDIDLDQMLIHVNRTVQRIAVENENTKTKLMMTSPKSIYSIREIPISTPLRQLLLTVKKEGQEYLLCGTRPMEPRTYENHFKKYLKASSIKNYNFHVIRHTFATNCIDNGMDVKSLSEILGHSDVQITLGCYVHPTLDTKRRYLDALSCIYGQYCGQKL